MAFVTCLFAASTLPYFFFALQLYRQNLAMAQKTYPAMPPLRQSDRLLVISPHCDDETLGVGGIMAKQRDQGGAVRVVFLTNGDGSRSTQIYTQAHELKTRVSSLFGVAPSQTTQQPTTNLFQRIAAMRQRETLQACAQLGIGKKDVTFLGYPDGGLRAMWESNWSPSNPYFSTYTNTSRSPYNNSLTPRAIYCGKQVLSDLEQVIRRWRPTLIVTTHPEDTHPDHATAFAYTTAALTALRQSPDPKTRAMASRVQLRSFVVHHGLWPVPHGYHPDAALAPPAALTEDNTHWMTQPLSPSQRTAKKAALESYVSQLAFTPQYLRSFVRRNELLGVVKPHALQQKNQSTPLVTLLQDAPCDSFWRERWGAADIRSLQAHSPRAGGLTLKVNLGSAPSSHVRYRLTLHSFSHAHVRAFEIEVLPLAGTPTANLQTLGSNARTSLSAQPTARGFNVDILLESLTGKPTSIGVTKLQPTTLLVSASTQWGDVRLDQTATATLSLTRPTGKSVG